MTNSRKPVPTTTTITTTTTANQADLPTQLRQLNLRATAEQLDDLLARATRQRLAPRALLEELAARELADHAQRNQQRLLAQARPHLSLDAFVRSPISTGVGRRKLIARYSNAR